MKEIQKAEVETKSEEKVILELTKDQAEIIKVALSFRPESTTAHTCLEILMRDNFPKEFLDKYFPEKSYYWSCRYDINSVSFADMSLKQFMTVYTASAERCLDKKIFQKIYKQNQELFKELVDWAFLPPAKRNNYPLVNGFRENLVEVANENDLLTDALKLHYVKSFCQKGSNQWIVSKVGLDNLADSPVYRKYLYKAKDASAQRLIAKTLDIKKVPFIVGFEDEQAKIYIEGRMNGIHDPHELDTYYYSIKYPGWKK